MNKWMVAAVAQCAEVAGQKRNTDIEEKENWAALHRRKMTLNQWVASGGEGV